jgi:hypothetical protein|tara:strand:+ start:1698 stop:1961 length:264 start_codon:yes stop_codon:yes gene_type:complete
MTIRDMEERIEWWEKEGKKEMDELVGKPNIENMLLMIDDIEFYIEKYGIGKMQEGSDLLEDKITELKRSLEKESTLIYTEGGSKNNV